MSKEEIKKQIKNGLSGAPFMGNIKKLSLFGSRLNEEYRDDSDVDLLIEFDPSAKMGFFELVRIQKALEQFLKKNVDLITPNSLSRYFRDEVLNSCEVIYEK